MNIAIIGYGEFGRAIGSLLEHNGLAFEYAEKTRFLTTPADLVFLTVPTQSMRQALQANKAIFTNDTIVVNCTKGIEEETHLLVHQIAKSVIGDLSQYYALMGPSFAEDVIDKDPTIVSLGYISEKHIKTIKQAIETEYFRIESLEGCRAVELASALKNVYAILCGYAHGLGFGRNTEAKLITLALQEFEALAQAMDFTHFDCTAPAVVGDMVLTCTSDKSRNYRFGLLLATKGPHETEISATTVEGYHTSHSIQALCDQFNVELPLASLTAEIIGGRVETESEFRDFLTKR